MRGMSKPQTYGELIEALRAILPNNAGIEDGKNGELVVYTGLKRENGNPFFTHAAEKLVNVDQG